MSAPLNRFWEGASLKATTVRVDLVTVATQQVPRYLHHVMPLLRIRVCVQPDPERKRWWRNFSGRTVTASWRVVGYSPIGQVQAGMGLGWKGDALPAAATDAIRVALDQWLEQRGTA